MSPLPSNEGAASAQANPEMLGNFDIGAFHLLRNSNATTNITDDAL